MAIGIVGRKVGMTRVFNEEGASIPVTVIEVEPNRVTQVRNPETDGYSAVQVTTGQRRMSRVNKPTAGHLAKAGQGHLGVPARRRRRCRHRDRRRHQG